MSESEFETWLQRDRGMITRIAASHERRQDLIDEIVQDVLLAMLRHFESPQDEPPTRAFVARVCRNIAISHVRRESKRNHETLVTPPASEPVDPLERTTQQEEREALMDAVRGLPEKYRACLTLHLEQMTHAEISAALEISSGSVAVRLSRARQMLFEELGGRDDES